MKKLQRLERENTELREELQREKINYERLNAYYLRNSAAIESLMQDVVNFMGPHGLPPHSIFGSQLLAALGKANALLHGLENGDRP